MLTHLTRWYGRRSPEDGDGGNGELLALSGPAIPIPESSGSSKRGRYADLLVVDGDPLAEHRNGRRAGQEPRRHHEGRQGPQGRPPFVMGAWGGHERFRQARPQRVRGIGAKRVDWRWRHWQKFPLDTPATNGA